jgi:tripartite-type tricarboxylate transporter receptor subunit TctC
MTRLLGALLALGFLGAGVAAAQTAYPSKTITIVVPASPGGVTDTLARQLAQRLTERWGQQAVVENRPGANNSIAAEYVAKSAPDGHTLFIGPDGTFVANPSLYPKLPYDPDKSFTPITGLVLINHALITNPSVPVSSVKDLLDLAKQKPGTINYGTFGIGSSGHMNMELLQNMSGAKFQAVHYKGATPALTDVVAGHIR